MGLGQFFNLCIHIILFIVCLVFSIGMIKKKKWIFVPIPVIIMILIVFFIWYRSGAYLQTGIKDNYIYIIGRGTGSMGSDAKYEIHGDDILYEVAQYDKGGYVFPELVFGWKFEPKSSGKCDIYYIEYNCGEWQEPIVYSVTVDENMQVSMSDN